MTRNTYLIIGLVLVFIIAGFMFVKQRGGGEVLAPTGEEVSVPGETNQTNETEEATSTTPAAQTITYNESGFSPKSLTVKAGDTVVFKNNSSKDFWPASAVHPTHTIYPEFDAKKTISAGESYSFTFTRVGSWKYHDHLNPSLTGTITVQ